jgi:hypothetical protein
MDTMKNRAPASLATLVLALGVFGFVAIAQAASVDHIPPTWDQILPASKRFVPVMGGDAIRDRETGLVWEKSPDSRSDWDHAQIHCNSLKTGGRLGWRVPTVQELLSLVDPSIQPGTGPTLPDGHPFTNILPASYWTATATQNPSFGDVRVAWGVTFNGGFPFYVYMSNPDFNTWCVRGGQGVDVQ